jgi:hypothetical protein
VGDGAPMTADVKSVAHASQWPHTYPVRSCNRTSSWCSVTAQRYRGWRAVVVESECVSACLDGGFREKTRRHSHQSATAPSVFVRKRQEGTTCDIRGLEHSSVVGSLSERSIFLAFFFLLRLPLQPRAKNSEVS